MNLFSIIVLLGSGAATHASITYFNSPAYRAKSDNPFLSTLEGGSVYIEDFENQGTQPPRYQLTTPYATGWNGISSGSAFWGVQEDYSESNPLGRTWTSRITSSENTKPPTGIHFDFSPDSSGRLPEFAGAALLGRFDTTTTGSLYNSILVYDKDGNEVTQGEWRIRAFSFSSPPPPENYFLNFEGIYVPGGISRIHFRDFLEVDHLTYGYSAIPEPASAGLAAAAALAFGLRRKRLA